MNNVIESPPAYLKHPNSNELDSDNDDNFPEINKSIIPNAPNAPYELHEYNKYNEYNKCNEISITPEHISWDMIEYEEIQKIEHDQIEFVRKLIEETLRLEYINSLANVRKEFYNKYDIQDIVQNIDIDIKYKRLHITIKKEHPLGASGIGKKILKKVGWIAGDVILFHPFKAMGLFAIIITKFI